MEVERQITWFDKKLDRVAGELAIDHVSLDELKVIFNPPPEDSLMYNPYTIRRKHMAKLSKLISLTFNFKDYSYQVDCFQKTVNS